MKVEIETSSEHGEVQGIIVKWPRKDLRVCIDVTLDGVLHHPDAIRCVPGGEFIEAEYRWEGRHA